MFKSQKSQLIGIVGLSFSLWGCMEFGGIETGGSQGGEIGQVSQASTATDGLPSAWCYLSGTNNLSGTNKMLYINTVYSTATGYYQCTSTTYSSTSCSQLASTALPSLATSYTLTSPNDTVLAMNGTTKVSSWTCPVSGAPAVSVPITACTAGSACSGQPGVSAATLTDPSTSVVYTLRGYSLSSPISGMSVIVFDVTKSSSSTYLSHLIFQVTTATAPTSASATFSSSGSYISITVIDGSISLTKTTTK